MNNSIDLNPAMGVIAKATRAGIRFFLEDDKVKFGVPKDVAVNKALLEEIRAYRDEIRAILAGDAVWFDEATFRGTSFPDDQDTFDVTIQQRKAYLKFLLLGDSSFNVSFNIKIENPDRELLEESLNALIDRHESLRTTFITLGGKLQQRVHRSAPAIPQIRYVHAADTAGGGDLRKIYLECMAIRFNLEKGPLLDVMAVVYPDGSNVLFFTAHHAISDDISSRIFESDFTRLYHSKCRETLPALKLQYKEYASWVTTFAATEKFKSAKRLYLDKIKASLSMENAVVQRSYRKELKTEMESIPGNAAALYYEEALGTMANINPKPGSSYISFMQKALLEKARKLAVSCDSSLFMTLMAVFGLLFIRQHRRKMLRMGITFNTRVFEDLTKVTGWFTGDAIACLEADEDLSIYQFIRSSTMLMLDVSRFRFYPYEQIIHELDVPLDVLIPLQLNLIHKTDMEYNDLTPVHMEATYNHYDFKCNLIEFGNCVLMKTDYNRNTHSKEDIEQVMEAYLSLIELLSDKDVLSTKLAVCY